MAKGRPEKLTDDLKRKIAKIKKSNSNKWTLSMIQAELRQHILESVRKEHPTWDGKLLNSEVDSRLPGISSIQKYIKIIIQPKLDVPSELDPPWHLGTLEDYPLPVEAIPYILLVQDVMHEPVTIRQARWIARLYTIFGDYHRIKGKEKRQVAAELYNWSKGYATHEIICRLAGTPFDTSELDKALREGSTLVVTGNQWAIFHRDNTFTVDPKTAKQLNQKKEGKK